MVITGLLFVLFLTLPAIAAEGVTLKVASIFGDHMVVQAGKPIPVWGWAKPGTKVEVNLLDAKTVTATAGKDGRWMAKVSPVKTGQTGTMTPPRRCITVPESPRFPSTPKHSNRGEPPNKRVGL